MASRAELEKMLIEADAAGDEESAALFADELRKLSDPVIAAPTQPAAPQRDVRAEYDALPGWQKPIAAVGDVARLAGSGIGLGYSEKALAGIRSMLGGGDYDQLLSQERQATQDARTRAGSAALPAEITGGMVTGSAASRLGISATKQIPEGIGALQRILGVGAGAAIEGGAYGALQASGNDQDIAEGTKTGAAFGAGAGVAGESLRSVLNMIANVGRAKTPPAPSMRDLEDQSAALRESANNRGVEIRPDAVADMNSAINTNVGLGNPTGLRPGTTPKAMSEIDRLAEYSPSLSAPTERAIRTVTNSDGMRQRTASINGRPPKTTTTDFVDKGDVERSITTYNMKPDRGMSLYDMDNLRQTVNGNLRESPDGAERAAAGQITRQIDDFLSTLDDTKATAKVGTPQEAVEMLTDARALDHRRLKMKEIQKLMDSAHNAGEVKSSPSGTELRAKVRNFLEDERNLQGYKPDEIAGLQGIMEGSPAADRWLKASKFINGIPGRAAASGAGAGLGYAIGGTQGAMVGGTVGAGASGVISNIAAGRAAKASEGQAKELLDVIARGGAKPRPAPRATGMSKGLSADMIRALTLLGLEDQIPQ